MALTGKEKSPLLLVLQNANETLYAFGEDHPLAASKTSLRSTCGDSSHGLIL